MSLSSREPSSTWQLPAGALVGGAQSAAMASYSTWMLLKPVVGRRRVMVLPSRVQASLLLVAPMPVETMFPAAPSQLTVPKLLAGLERQTSRVQPSVPEVNSLLWTMVAGGRGVA